MKTTLVLAIALFMAQNQVPKNDPNGVWEAETGTRFAMQLSGENLRVQLVEGSHPTFLKYEVNLKNAAEPNTYTGSGYFIAKMKNGKECKLDTDWQIIVVQKDMIVGSTSNVAANSDTCEVTQRGSSMIVLKKK
jgi:hypothetical protein